MDKIKTPVYQNNGTSAIMDRDGEIVATALRIPFAKEIADALNTAADQSRVIEVMQTGLEYYRFTCERGYCGHAHRDELPKCHVEGCECVSLDNRAAKALAEAARIMEGK